MEPFSDEFSLPKFITSNFAKKMTSIHVGDCDVISESPYLFFCLRHIQATNTMVKIPVLSTMTAHSFPECGFEGLK